MSKSKKELFLELAQPDENGVSRWVSVTEFVGKYQGLFGVGVPGSNGGTWCRDNSALAKEFKLEKAYRKAQGNPIDRIRLNGYNTECVFNQNIRQDIKNHYKQQCCAMCGVRGNSENTQIEVDHKDGRKNDPRVSDLNAQTFDDFQALCKACNDKKRQICKECKESGYRFDARKIPGNHYPFYDGEAEYDGCVGCYQYDPIQYRKTCNDRIYNEGYQKGYGDGYQNGYHQKTTL
ncbi:HNH endonuclease [Helicobacter pylori]|uniref:HNH endonuclease n=1 Tax=Helicobacter pylori TaxID=210 RepID=UPI0009A34E69|nr:HNH endonuclease [Helicobacter pylori]NHB18547.1 HNH endonuclease [Helicobacter pylori]QEF45041.1 HNH endonuclease [Helicobacter pylori]